jgi:hypothetical protein
MKVVEQFEFGDRRDRVLVIESVSDGGRSWVLISLEGGMSSPNPDAIEGCKIQLGYSTLLRILLPKV